MEKEEYGKYVSSRFSNSNDIWRDDNHWSLHVKWSINTNIKKFFELFPVDETSLVMNAGSGGTIYSSIKVETFDCDLHLLRLEGCNLGVCANVERLPFKDCSFTHILCVGSVINYADPVKCIYELSRVLKYGGKLLLDYDSSQSWEFIFTKSFNQPVSFIKTFYNDTDDHIYVYSPSFINSIFQSNDLTILKESPYHCISPLAYLLIKNERWAGWFGKADNSLSKFPFFKNLSSSRFIFAKKGLY